MTAGRWLPAALLLAGLLLLSTWAVAPPAQAGDDTIVRTVSNRTVHVAKPRAPRGILARTGVVLDAQTGMRLWGRRAEQRRLVASTTKIMTALVAISRTSPNQMITASNYRAGVGESLLGLKPGERMSAQDLIKGLLLESGNDAADTLAAGTARSRAAFVLAMNRRARALDLNDTHFANAIGLDARGNYSTAADLAQLARVALTVPRFANVADKARATLRTGWRERRIENRNPLIARHRWAIGVKTGHTMAAGYLLVGAAEKLDAKVISVVTGEPSEGARLDDSEELLEYGRAFYRPVRSLGTRRAVATLPVALQDITVKVYPRRDHSFAARNGERVRVELSAPKEIKGPRSKGSIVGQARVIRGGRQVASVPVALGAAVPAPPITAVMLHALGRVLPWLLLIAAGLLIGMAVTRRAGTRVRRPRFVG